MRREMQMRVSQYGKRKVTRYKEDAAFCLPELRYMTVYISGAFKRIITGEYCLARYGDRIFIYVYTAKLPSVYTIPGESARHNHRVN